MPYKYPQDKKNWELRHREERLARRRELRSIDTAQPSPPRSLDGAAFAWPLLIAGGALASYSPVLGLSAGSLTLIVAAVRGKNWCWWIIGAFIAGVALLFLYRGRDSQE